MFVCAKWFSSALREQPSKGLEPFEGLGWETISVCLVATRFSAWLMMQCYMALAELSSFWLKPELCFSWSPR